MNQIYFSDTYMFQEKYELLADNWWLVDEDLLKDDSWFAGLNCFNNSPSLNNLSFEDIITQKFMRNNNLDDNLSLILNNEKDNESIHDEDLAWMNADKDENWAENLNLWNVQIWTGNYQDPRDKTTQIDSIFKIETSKIFNWEIQDQFDIINEETKQKNSTDVSYKDLLEIKYLNSDIKESEENKKFTKRNVDVKNSTSKIYPVKLPFRRWGKDKDKLAFKMLQDMCKDSGISFEQFIKVEESEIIDEYAQIFTNELYSSIIERIANELGWMKRPIYLFHRFQKIHSQSDSLSIREVKFLKQLLADSSSDSIDYSLIEFHFPCKSKQVTLNKILNFKQYIFNYLRS